MTKKMIVLFLISLLQVSVYANSVLCKDVIQSISQTSQTSWRVEQQELHRFILDNSPADASRFDFLISEDDFVLASVMLTSPKVVNSLFIKLMQLEKAGYVYTNANGLEGLLRYLLEKSQIKANHLKIKYQFKASCALGVCVPKMIEDYIITLENQVVPQLYLEYPVVISLWGKKFLLYERRELEVDLGTSAIRTQNQTGRAYMDLLVRALALNEEKDLSSVFIFIDLNNLGQINYFDKGQESGDQYISAFGNVIKKILRKQDQFFRIGGDEFVILAPDLNKSDIQDYLQRIVDDFSTSLEAKAVFEAQWNSARDKIESIANFNSYSDLEKSSLYKILDEEWLQVAKRNWARFLVNFNTIYKAKLLFQLEKQSFILEPSVSIGSKIIAEDDNFNSLNTLASCEAGICKRVYKEAKGVDTTKYGGVPANEVLLTENVKNHVKIKPPVRPPMD